MFTFVQSAAAKLATHNSRSAVTSVRSGTIVEQPYGANLYEELIERRLRAIEARDHTFLSDVRSAGRRVFGKAKKLLAKRNQTHSVAASDESFCSPGSLDDDEMEIPVNLIFRRPRVRNRRNVCTKAPWDVHGIYIADAEGSYGPGYEVGCSVSETAGTSNQLETTIIISTRARATSKRLVDEEDGDVAEVGDGASTPSVLETGYATVRIETQAGDDADTPDLECSDAASHIAVVKPGKTWATPFPVSPFFCMPTTESTLAPPTPSEGESGPSTPRSMPVLVYESDSYEDALFAEFNAIIDEKAANETRSVE